MIKNASHILAIVALLSFAVFAAGGVTWVFTELIWYQAATLCGAVGFLIISFFFSDK